MTAVEHLILGAVISHLGFHQRYGPRITAVIMAASVLPDADAVAYIGGQQAFFTYHRAATHSLGAALAAATALATLCAGACALARALATRDLAGDRLRRVVQPLAAPRRAGNPLSSFPLVFGASFLAVVAHILVDALYPWPVPLFWPLWGRRMGLEVLNWSEPAILGIMLAAMFGLGIFRGRTRIVALASLGVLASFAGARHLMA